MLRSRRYKVTLTLWAVAALVLSACGGGESASPDNAPSAESGATNAAGGDDAFPTGDITLTVWDSAEEPKQELFQDVIIPAYEELHPNVTIDYSFYDTGDLQTKAVVALGTGQGPDVFEIQGTNMPKIIDAGLAAPAEDSYFAERGGVQGVIDEYLPGLLDAVTRDGKLYGLPDQQNSWSLFINNRMFEEAGLDPIEDAPETWADIEQLNKVLTKTDANGNITQKGFDFRYQSGDQWYMWMLTALVYQAGGQMLVDGEPDFNGPAGLEAIENWKKATVAPRISNNTGSSPYQDFADEHDAMAFGGPNMGAFAASINPAMEGNYTVVPLPQIDPSNPVNFYYSFNLAVNAKSSPEEQQVAWDFIRFALDDPQQWWSAAMMLQPKKDWYKTPEAQETVGIDVFVHDTEIARPLPATEHWDELQKAVVRAVQSIILEEQDPQTALDAAAEEYRRAAS